MPFAFVQLAAAERIEHRTCSDGNICDDEASVVCGQVVVDGVGEDSESIIEEVDKNENGADEETKLAAGSYLKPPQYSSIEHLPIWICLTIRLVMLIFENWEKFRVARSGTPPPTEDEGSALAVSLLQEGAEKITRELDC